MNEHNLKIPHLHTPIDVETLQCTGLPSLKLTLNFTQPSYSTDVHVVYRLSARKLRLACRVQIPVEVIAFVGAQIPLKWGWTYLFSPIWKLIATSLGKIGSACCLATQPSKNLLITTATKPSVFKLWLYTPQGDYSINNIKKKTIHHPNIPAHFLAAFMWIELIFCVKYFQTIFSTRPTSQNLIKWTHLCWKDEESLQYIIVKKV